MIYIGRAQGVGDLGVQPQQLRVGLDEAARHLRPARQALCVLLAQRPGRRGMAFQRGEHGLHGAGHRGQRVLQPRGRRLLWLVDQEGALGAPQHFEHLDSVSEGSEQGAVSKTTSEFMAGLPRPVSSSFKAS